MNWYSFCFFWIARPLKLSQLFPAPWYIDKAKYNTATYQFVFGLEWMQSACAVLPVAHIIVVIQSANVLIVYVSNNVLHYGELLATWFGFGEGLLIHP